MANVGKKDFERIFQGGEVEQFCGKEYNFNNYEEDFFLTYDVTLCEFTEKNGNFLSESQLNKIEAAIIDFYKESLEDTTDPYADPVLNDEEIYKAFY